MMNWPVRILEFLIGFIAVLGVLFLVATTYGWEKIWTSQFGSPDLGPVVFEGLEKGPNPNQALICPDGVCKDEDRDSVSPVYALGMDDLKKHFLKSLEAEKSLTRVDDGSDPLRMRFVQRSRVFRFPDTINVQFFALGDDRSTLALYSQAQIGVSDFGANPERLERWLKRLTKFEDGKQV